MAILLTIAVGASVLASGTLASGTPAVGPLLPAPIVITAGSVSFEITRDERITRIRTPAWRSRKGSTSQSELGVLTSAVAARTWRLASLASLGMSRSTWLQPVGKLLALEDLSRLLVLRRGGSVFASTPLREWSYGGISSQVVPAPDGNAVAFTATNGQIHATETVYVLRPGRHAATALYHETVTPGVCAQGAGVEWHGVWLLYSNVENDIAAVDTAGAHRTVDLTRLVNRLPGMRNGFTAYWSG
jgi:hypothetical protein